MAQCVPHACRAKGGIAIASSSNQSCRDLDVPEAGDNASIAIYRVFQNKQ